MARPALRAIDYNPYTGTALPPALRPGATSALHPIPRRRSLAARRPPIVIEDSSDEDEAFRNVHQQAVWLSKRPRKKAPSKKRRKKVAKKMVIDVLSSGDESDEPLTVVARKESAKAARKKLARYVLPKTKVARKKVARKKAPRKKAPKKKAKAKPRKVRGMPKWVAEPPRKVIRKSSRLPPGAADVPLQRPVAPPPRPPWEYPAGYRETRESEAAERRIVFAKATQLARAKATRLAAKAKGEKQRQKAKRKKAVPAWRTAKSAPKPRPPTASEKKRAAYARQQEFLSPHRVSPSKLYEDTTDARVKARRAARAKRAQYVGIDRGSLHELKPLGAPPFVYGETRRIPVGQGPEGNRGGIQEGHSAGVRWTKGRPRSSASVAGGAKGMSERWNKAMEGKENYPKWERGYKPTSHSRGQAAERMQLQVPRTLHKLKLMKLADHVTEKNWRGREALRIDPDWGGPQPVAGCPVQLKAYIDLLFSDPDLFKPGSLAHPADRYEKGKAPVGDPTNDLEHVKNMVCACAMETLVRYEQATNSPTADPAILAAIVLLVTQNVGSHDMLHTPMERTAKLKPGYSMRTSHTPTLTFDLPTTHAFYNKQNEVVSMAEATVRGDSLEKVFVRALNKIFPRKKFTVKSLNKTRREVLNTVQFQLCPDMEGGTSKVPGAMWYRGKPSPGGW
jgi:hypothetical protein